MSDVEQICARLFASGTLARDDARDLEHPQIRTEVEARLNACGLALATSAYSNYYGLVLRSDVADATVLDAPTNLELKADGCALLTVLWARLALQQRTVEDTQEIPTSQPLLLPQDRAARARSFTPSVRFETLAQEFGSRLGGRTRLRGLLSQLRRLRFITYNRLDDIQAGPLLELAIDGEKMIDFVRSRVLSELLNRTQSRVPADQEPAKPSPTDAAAKSVLGGSEDTPIYPKRALGVK